MDENNGNSGIIGKLQTIQVGPPLPTLKIALPSKCKTQIHHFDMLFVISSFTEHYQLNYGFHYIAGLDINLNCLNIKK